MSSEWKEQYFTGLLYFYPSVLKKPFPVTGLVEHNTTTATSGQVLSYDVNGCETDSSWAWNQTSDWLRCSFFWSEHLMRTKGHDIMCFQYKCDANDTFQEAVGVLLFPLLLHAYPAGKVAGFLSVINSNQICWLCVGNRRQRLQIKFHTFPSNTPSLNEGKANMATATLIQPRSSYPGTRSRRRFIHTPNRVGDKIGVQGILNNSSQNVKLNSLWNF